MASSATQLNALPMEVPKSTTALEQNVHNRVNNHNSTNCGSISKSRPIRHQPPPQQTFLKFDQLPDLILDKILNLLEPQDLRSSHQVSKSWQNILLRRPRIDSRRVELVTKIRLNKENIARGCSLDSATPSSKKTNGGGGVKSHDGKPGSRSILRTVSNSRPNSAITSTKKPPPRTLSTPTSRFLQEYEAGNKLLHGQILFRCPKCTGPVPSPISATTISRHQHQGSFRKMIDTSTPQKSSGVSNSPASNITQDSGFESPEVPNDQLSIDEDIDTTAEEIALSFIATPPSSMEGKSSRTELSKVKHMTEQSPIDSERSFSIYNTSSSSSSSDHHHDIQLEDHQEGSIHHQDNESTECPKCSHRFCCNCQCTEHPGRPCREINGDSLLFSDTSNNVGTNHENTNLKSDKAKRSKKALRRIARI